MREGGWGAGRLGDWRRAHLSLSITYLQRSHLRMRDGCSCRPECAGAARPQGASSRLPPGAQSPATGTGGGGGWPPQHLSGREGRVRGARRVAYSDEADNCETPG